MCAFVIGLGRVRMTLKLRQRKKSEINHGARESKNQDVIDFFFSKGPQINYTHREFVKL